MIEKLSGEREWVDAGQGFEAEASAVRLAGWSKQRRTIVLRRRVTNAVAATHDDDSGVAQLSFAEIGEATEVYECSVLVTSLVEETEAFGQLYRDRGDGENIFGSSGKRVGDSGGSKGREHAGEDLEAEILLVSKSIGASLKHADLVVEALDETE